MPTLEDVDIEMEVNPDVESHDDPYSLRIELRDFAYEKFDYDLRGLAHQMEQFLRAVDEAYDSRFAPTGAFRNMDLQ